MRVRLKPLEGEAECWDGTPESLERIRMLIADELIGVHDEHLLLRRKEGRIAHIPQGWYIVIWEGEEKSNVHSSGNFLREVEPYSSSA